MPGHDPVDDETPIFTQREVYMIGGYVATWFGADPTDEEVVAVIDRAVKAALNRERR